MTDQIPEAFTPATTPSIDLDAIENVLTLDGIIEGARLPERVVRICKRGDLLGTLDQVEGRLEELTDDDGELIVTDDALGDEGEVQSLVRQALELRTEIAKNTFPFRVRAMGSAKWKSFVAEWEDTRTKAFKPGMNDALIIKSAISPVIANQQELDRFRAAFAHTQTNAVFSAAFLANTKSGLDIPKLPDSLVALKHEERS